MQILNIFRAPLRLTSGAYYALRDVSRYKDLSMDNKILRENMDNLEKKILDLGEINLENQRLRRLLGFIESRQHKVVPAMVIARDPLAMRDTIIIDKGKKQDVRINMDVISGNGLVGRVMETGWSISRVLLITDRDSIVSGIVQRTREEGAVLGNMRRGLVMKYMELDSDVKEGDEIITSGFGGMTKKGLLIGSVVSVEIDESGLYKNAIVKPEVDMMRLEEALVIR